MIDSIKVSEVTDVVTPEEETYPPNYNFSMESTWEDQTFSAGGGGGIIPTGTKTISITENGTTTEDVTNYAGAEITANVPNSYSASDEGKVVDNGALVAQTSQSITENGTYDTTLKNSVVVNVPSGSQVLASGTFVGNGTNMGDNGLFLPVGTKMAQTDFIFCFWADNGTNIIPTDGTDRMAVWAQTAINKIFTHYDLSSDGTKTAQDVLTYPTATSAGGDTFTNRTPTSRYVNAGFVRTNTTVNESAGMSIVRESTGFKIKYSKGGGSQYKMMNGLTYNWKVIYFGSDPENDIVEVA